MTGCHAFVLTQPVFYAPSALFTVLESGGASYTLSNSFNNDYAIHFLMSQDIASYNESSESSKFWCCFLRTLTIPP